VAWTNGRGQGPELVQPDTYPVDELATPCALCGVHVVNQHYSCAAGAVCCERCHFNAAPPASREVHRWRPPVDERLVVEGKGATYAEQVKTIWERLEETTRMPVFVIERGRLAAYCPVCRTGTLTIQFLDSPPRWRAESQFGFDFCSDGCSTARIAEALQ
jgi:hypothetical protein